MSFIPSEEETLLRETAADFFREKMPVAHFRTLRDGGDANGFDPALWQEMVKLGFAGILIDEAHGGSGFGLLGAQSILEESGRHLSPSPFLATALVAASALSHDEGAAKTYLPAIASGEALWALALEEGAHHAPDKIKLAAQADGGKHTLTGEKTFIADGMAADYFLVAARLEGKPALLIVDAKANGLKREPMHMADSRNYAELALDGVAAELLSADEKHFERVLDIARAGMAAEMLGGALEMFERTLDYLKERKQFGQIIGSFQALKHRAAVMFCELELARSVVRDAFVALAQTRDDASRAASLAKAKLNDVAKLVSNEAVQLHGGMGMTDEADPGLYLKRARLQAASYGDSHFHRARYAALEGF